MSELTQYNLKFFFSGNMGRAGPEEERLAEVIECRLCSCHETYVKDAERWSFLASLPETNIQQLMLDSGAFTAWSKGKHVNIQELIKVYGAIMEKVDHTKVQVWLINLDVIPGSAGKTASDQEIDEAIRQSDVNFGILTKAFGNRVVPVYHQNETEARLKQVEQMAQYICASPRNDLPEWTRVRWSEEVHAKIKPGTKTHGLATTGVNMINRVPWWSVDSAAWLYSGAMGKIDCWNGTKWVSINISQESPDRFNFGKHFDNCDPHTRQVVEERAAAHGLEIEKLRTDHMARKLLNGLEIVEFLKQFKFQSKLLQEGLFDL